MLPSRLVASGSEAKKRRQSTLVASDFRLHLYEAPCKAEECPSRPGTVKLTTGDP